MQHTKGTVALVVLGLMISLAWGNGDDTAVSAMRARLAELGRAVIEEIEGQVPKQNGPPYERTPREEGLYQLSRVPREPIRQAIDQVLKSGTKEERIGALVLYGWIVPKNYGAFQEEPLHPSYLPVIYDLLAQDDRTMPAYTGALAGALSLYPMSRETVLIYMDIAQRTSDVKRRENYLVLAADAVGLDLPIYKQTPPLEKQKILADFERWFEKNKKYVAFDEKGRSLLAGSKVHVRPARMSPEDRSRIRQDPVCVLRLMQASIGEPCAEETVRDLVKKCGEALYGVEAAALVARGLDTPQDSSEEAMDLQLAIARVQGQYPVTDAVLLAVGYVAAYDSDPKNRELARISLDQFGSPDIPRVLKGEPKVVHEKMEELADEVLKD